MSPPLELMVVKYVAEVHGDWSSFRVFTTGRPDTYLFDQIDRWGCSTGLQVPIRSTDLSPGSAPGPTSGPGVDDCGRCRAAGTGAPTLAGLRPQAVSGATRPTSYQEAHALTPRHIQAARDHPSDHGARRDEPDRCEA